jgi:endoglucanase
MDRTSRIPLALGIGLAALCARAATAEFPVTARTIEGHTVLDLRPAMNQSCFDDGAADNGTGGWTDEGLNDFRTYPPLDFGAKRYRGYLFDLVDPAQNNGRNLVMTGLPTTWPDLPTTVRLSGFEAKGSHLYVMHTEGRMAAADGEVGGVLTLEYADGTTARRELRFGKELANWYQGKWWSNCEEPRPDAPAMLKESGCDPDKFKQLGGENFPEIVLKHADAVRWPVTQGFNTVSRNWSVPVVFWALAWRHPHPEKAIRAVTLESAGKALIAVAAVTVSDTDFTLDRQTLGAMSRPPDAPAGFFEAIAAQAEEQTLPLLLAQPWSKGLRDVEIRSDRIVTVRLDQVAKFAELQQPKHFRIVSADDPAFAQGLVPDKVHRFSRASRYRPLAGQYQVFSDHWLHLVLPQPLKPGKAYRVEILPPLLPEADSLCRSLEFSLDRTPNPSFKVNQVGYSRAASVKHAYLSSYLGDGPPVDLAPFTRFEVRDEATGKRVLAGEVKLHAEKDIQGLDRLFLLDLSSLRPEGTFHLWIDGLGRSYPFRNGDGAARALYDLCHRGLYFQRAGIAIEPPHADRWPRPMAHDKVYVTKANLTHPGLNYGPVDPANPAAGPYHLPEGPKPIHGGHYDAGDFDLRPMHIRVPELLLTLYEGCPEKFADGQVSIPENGNGVPDILDEAAWNLLSLEYLQDYARDLRGLDGGVPPGYESYAHPAPGMGHEDTLPYFMRQVTAYFTFSAAANFAHAARLFRPFDAKRAARYLDRAERAWRYAVAQPDEPQPTLPKGGIDQGEGWEPRQLQGARAWAAGHLFAATGKDAYWQDFKAHYGEARAGVAGAVPYWAIVWGILGNDRPIPEPAVREQLRTRLLAAADKEVAFVAERGRLGYRAATPEGGGWGNTSCLPRNVEAATRAWLLTRRQDYLDAVATSIDFPLGMNPSEMSWMTGGGSACPMDPCSHNSLYDDEEEPLPGILIYGPTNAWQNSKVVLHPDKSAMGFYRRVVDAWGNIAGNEYTVWETQAPFLFAVGILLPDQP